MMKTVVVYGSEKWPKTEADMARLDVWREILRKICDAVVEQGTWSIRTNQEQHRLNQDSEVANIKIRE
jgi:hypothetical protein